MNGVFIMMGEEELREAVREVVRDALSELVLKPADSWGANGTVSFADITERYGISRTTYWRGVKDGRYPPPADTHTKEYRFNADAVIKAFEAESCDERSLRIRPDMRRIQRKKGRA